MLTKSLSRSDYNKEKKVATPKTLPRVVSQIAVRTHLLEATDSLVVESIKRYIQSQKSRDIQQISYLEKEPSLHMLQVRVQDLNRLLANRDDEITGLKNEKQKNEKKIQILEKNVFDLTIQLQKNEYEYKFTIDFLRAQNSTQKNDYLERITFLQEESKKFKQCYDNLLKNAKEIYDLRVKSFTEAKDSYKLASEDIMNGLKKDIHFHIGKNKQLRSEMFQNENQKGERLKYLEQENYILSERLEQRQLEYKLLIFTSNSEAQASNSVFQQLNGRIEEMIKTLQRQRQNFIHEKECIERVKVQKETKLRQNMQSILNEKQDIEVEFNKLKMELNDVKYENELLQNKCIEFSTKIQLMGIQKIHLEEYFQHSKQQLKKQHLVELENEISMLKKDHQQRIEQVQNDLQDKNALFTINQVKLAELQKELQNKNEELLKLDQKIHVLGVYIEGKNKQITDIKEKFIQKNVTLQRQLQAAKQQIQTIKIEASNQREELKRKILDQKSTETQVITTKFTKEITNLNQIIVQLKETHQSELELLKQQNQRLKAQISKKTESNALFLLEQNFLQKIPQSVSNFYQQPIDQQHNITEQLKKTIQQQAETLLKNSQLYKSIQLESYRIKGEKALKQKTIQRLHKEKRKLQKQHEKINSDAINKYAELRQRSQEVVRKLQQQNNRSNMKLHQIKNQIHTLQQKINSQQQAIAALQQQNQVIQSENKKIKEVLTLNEQNKSELLTQLCNEMNQHNDKVIQGIKEQNTRLQYENQALAKEIFLFKQEKLKYRQDIQKTDALMQIMDRLIQQKKAQVESYVRKLQENTTQIGLLQQRINDYQSFIASFQKQRQNLEVEKIALRQKLSKHQNYTYELRRHKIYDIREVQSIIEQNTSLKVKLENQRMELQYQTRQKRDYETYLNLAKEQLNILKNNHIQANQESTNNKVKQTTIQHSDTNKKLHQKVDTLQQQLNNKQQELNQTNNLLSQTQSNNKFNEKKIIDLQGMVKSYQRVVEELAEEEKKLKNVIEEKQNLILTFRFVSKSNEKKEQAEKSPKSNTQQVDSLPCLSPPSRRQSSPTHRQSPPTHRHSPQNNRQLSPREKIQEFRAKVDKIQQIREDILKGLQLKQRETVEKVQHKKGYIFYPTITGCLAEIENFLQQIQLLKGQNQELFNLYRTYRTLYQNYRTQGEARTRKFMKIMKDWKQCGGSLLKHQKQLSQKDQKWKNLPYIITQNNQKNIKVKNSETKLNYAEIRVNEFNCEHQVQNNQNDKEQMKIIDINIAHLQQNSKIKIIDYENIHQMKEIQQKSSQDNHSQGSDEKKEQPQLAESRMEDSQMMKVPFLPKSFPQNTTLVKLNHDETVKKQIYQDAPETVIRQGRPRRGSFRYQDKKQHEKE